MTKKPRKKAWSYQDWYVRNRARLNKLRRKVYKTDSTVREARITSAKAQYQKKAAAVDSGKPRRGRGPAKPKTVQIDGQTYTLFGLAHLVREAGLGKGTLQKWEGLGILPVCWVLDDFGSRWFPERAVTFVKKIVMLRAEFPSGGRSRVGVLDLFKKLVQAEWLKAKRSMPDLTRVRL